MTITLYDIPYNVPGKCGSPNCAKARITLDYKCLLYKTEWVEYPDIEPLMKKIGAPPTSKKPDGRDHYTLPVIHDSATGKTIADSSAIAAYLDATYPSTPVLFPPGSDAAIALFEYHITQVLARPLYAVFVPISCETLNPPSAAYYRRTREARFGCKLEDLAPPGPKRDEAWKKLKEGLSLLAGFLDKNGAGKPYFLGDTFSFADVILTAFLVVFMRTQNDEWQTIATLNDGRWGDIVRSTEKYLKVE